MACTATLKRRHDSLAANEQVPELPIKRRRFVPSQEVMAPSSPSSSPPPSSRSPTTTFPSLISQMSTEQLNSTILAELSRTRRRSEDEGHVTDRQLAQTCSRLLLQFETQLRTEYERILSEKLSEQYESFVKYTQDHLRNQKSEYSMSLRDTITMSLDSSNEWTTFLSQVKAIEKKDSNMTSDQQIDRLHKPGAKYLNLNPFYVLQVDPDASEDEIKKQFRRLSILLHPDKNPSDRERATNAFEVVNKANKLLKEEETLEKFKVIISDARNRVMRMIEEKRREAKNKGVSCPEDDPAKFSHLVNVMASKQLADYEIRKTDKDKKEQAEKKRASDEAETEAKRLKKIEDEKKKWEETREERVTTWKDFQNKGKKKKKTKHMLGTYKPPKPRLEERR